MATQNIVKDKSTEFALKIISLCDVLNCHKEFVLSKQLLRSGTSIGANISESKHAESRADFIHKLSISLKEAYETEYWLHLLVESRKISQKDYKELSLLNQDIIKLLCSIILSSKNKK
ncbi:four helix bundle protein [Hyphobacterium sp. CCMP332]|nr:four helix bundle protein [Hyphobacterium sp. CCMP332]